MNVIVLLVLQVIAYQHVRCQGGGGGPSTFGYDASSACSKPYSRSSRARFANLPCDLRRQNWCAIAGSAYPWHAVRRFVQENQGLMRRMYGDERHINVLRAEFERNDIELKDDDRRHHFAEEYRKYQYTHDYEDFESEANLKIQSDEYERRGFTSRSFNDNGVQRLNKFPKLSEYTRPHFRPTEKSTASTATIATPTSTKMSSITETPSSSMVTSSTTGSTVREPITTTAIPSTTISVNSVNNDGKENATETIEQSPVMISHIVKEQNFSINEIPEQIDRIDEEQEQEVVDDEEKTINVSDVPDADFDETSTISLPGTTELPAELDMNLSGELFATPKETTAHGTFSSSEQHQFKPRPEYRPANKPEASSMEGQLYQDVAAKDQQEQPVLKLRGVNACPVKEEVVAPFWANNTRGEVLALLNLYPFEQYVHWEKCTHENKQMYCRDGCRCEQQYRLHRLLAYDPNNECRGIFSDWFKFPSCCVCRCYDLPLEFRVTSRSPRTQKQIKVRPPRTRYA
ncbi:protein spaetzle 4 [Hylaeus anthracinus]|uniref:protein spaetzle 4 n=1 Tax=Hylaeus anthracinus TaxID=313031 RepID=UPI0023B9D8F9|nr:protein spaetzle 4 [Hylaeus anthracinus]